MPQKVYFSLLFSKFYGKACPRTYVVKLGRCSPSRLTSLEKLGPSPCPETKKEAHQKFVHPFVTLPMTFVVFLVAHRCKQRNLSVLGSDISERCKCCFSNYHYPCKNSTTVTIFLSKVQHIVHFWWKFCCSCSTFAKDIQHRKTSIITFTYDRNQKLQRRGCGDIVNNRLFPPLPPLPIHIGLVYNKPNWFYLHRVRLFTHR